MEVEIKKEPVTDDYEPVAEPMIENIKIEPPDTTTYMSENDKELMHQSYRNVQLQAMRDETLDMSRITELEQVNCEIQLEVEYDDMPGAQKKHEAIKRAQTQPKNQHPLRVVLKKVGKGTKKVRSKDNKSVGKAPNKKKVDPTKVVKRKYTRKNIYNTMLHKKISDLSTMLCDSIQPDLNNNMSNRNEASLSNSSVTPKLESSFEMNNNVPNDSDSATDVEEQSGTSPYLSCLSLHVYAVTDSYVNIKLFTAISLNFVWFNLIRRTD